MMKRNCQHSPKKAIHSLGTRDSEEKHLSTSKRNFTFNHLPQEQNPLFLKSTIISDHELTTFKKSHMRLDCISILYSLFPYRTNIIQIYPEILEHPHKHTYPSKFFETYYKNEQVQENQVIDKSRTLYRLFPPSKIKIGA